MNTENKLVLLIYGVKLKGVYREQSDFTSSTRSGESEKNVCKTSLFCLLVF